MHENIIYKIECTFNKRVYIGVTNNFNDRIYAHFYLLKSCNHYCGPLQYDYNLYGRNNFIAEIIFTNDDVYKCDAEHKTIRNIQGELLYNKYNGKCNQQEKRIRRLNTALLSVRKLKIPADEFTQSFRTYKKRNKITIPEFARDNNIRPSIVSLISNRKKGLVLKLSNEELKILCKILKCNHSKLLQQYY